MFAHLLAFAFAGLAPAQISTAAPNPAWFARQQPDSKVVRVTAAQVQSEDIAGTAFHTLRIRAMNQTGGNVNRIVVNYEIYALNSQRLVAAGKANLQPQNLLPNEEAQAQIMVDHGGRVRVTLIEWIGGNGAYKDFEQMETMPSS